MKEIRKILADYDNTDLATTRVALASVVAIEQSSYRRIGARMLVKSDGYWTGGISGGCLEGDALRQAQKAIFAGKPSIVVYDTLDDQDHEIGIGLGCNGRIEVLFNPIDPDDLSNEMEQLRSIISRDQECILLKIINHNQKLGHCQLIFPQDRSSFFGVESSFLSHNVEEVFQAKKSQLVHTDLESPCDILIEYFRPENHILIIGHNYDVEAMTTIAEVLGWKTTVVGRGKKLPNSVYQHAECVIEYEDAVNLKFSDYAACVLMTHDYQKDLTFLPLLLKNGDKYIGILGPKKRYQKLCKDLNLNPKEHQKRVFSPVGLDLGSETPEEIALAVSAEILAFIRNRSGTSLKFREGTIYNAYITTSK